MHAVANGAHGCGGIGHWHQLALPARHGLGAGEHRSGLIADHDQPGQPGRRDGRADLLVQLVGVVAELGHVAEHGEAARPALAMVASAAMAARMESGFAL